MSEVSLRIHTPPSLGFWPKLGLSGSRPMGSTLVHHRWGRSAPMAVTSKSLHPGSSARILPRLVRGVLHRGLLLLLGSLCMKARTPEVDVQLMHRERLSLPIGIIKQTGIGQKHFPFNIVSK